MKKITGVLFIALILLGCDDMLETTPRSVIASSSMWTNESDVEGVVNGMYSQARSTINNDRAFLFYYELRAGFWQFGSSGGGSGTIGWEDLMINSISSSTTSGTDWSNFYKTINAANLVIKYAPQINFRDEAKRKVLMSEAYFIRAFSYFTLARVYGNVPITVLPFESTNDKDQDIRQTRQDVNSVFKLIKEDIDHALENMVETGARGRIKASQAGINMLKADVYLWTSKRLNGGRDDLIIAESAVNQVLNNPQYQMLNNYEDVFRIEQNNELIFCFYFDVAENLLQYGRDFIYNPVQVAPVHRDNPVPVGGNNHWLTYSDSFVSKYIKSGDSRSNIINKDFIGNDGVQYRWVNKYIGNVIDGTRRFVNDIRIYRLAEALLFKAEILNALDRTSEAISELNKIAKRAYGIDGFYSSSLSKIEVDEMILHERIIEFAAEGKSWFDIVRFGKAFEIIPTLVGRENDYNGNILVLPVHPNIITRNPNIIQTTGY
jgi:starch-binding outer membrane protein, SusD/RagB family